MQNASFIDDKHKVLRRIFIHVANNKDHTVNSNAISFTNLGSCSIIVNEITYQ